MGMNLYVGNLSFDTTEADLMQAFGAHGTVTKAQLVIDRDTGRSRGFAFVEMSNGGDAAIAALNGAQLQGRTLTVNIARPKSRSLLIQSTKPRNAKAPAISAGAAFFVTRTSVAKMRQSPPKCDSPLRGCLQAVNLKRSASISHR
jgi:RNA recognition motif-containing protein